MGNRVNSVRSLGRRDTRFFSLVSSLTIFKRFDDPEMSTNLLIVRATAGAFGWE